MNFEEQRAETQRKKLEMLRRFRASSLVLSVEAGRLHITENITQTRDLLREVGTALDDFEAMVNLEKAYTALIEQED